MNKDQLQSSINTFWDNHILSTLIDYIKIPNKLPAFDSNWKSNGHMDRVLDCFLDFRWTTKIFNT